jgi:exonuclease VII large subunit
MCRLCIILLLQTLLVSAGTLAAETPPQITEREIIERLTRLEEGQKHLEESLRAEIQANARAIEQLRQDMNAQFSRIDAQFDRIDAQFGRIDAQFGRMTTLMLGIVGAFAAIVAATISFALWDRRTMIRPFEDKVKVIEEELAQNRQRLHALLEALRALGQSNDNVAEVLRRFGLL